ncbi:MAG: phosphoadenosine phosphosulfate reductase family protein [Verrucomicrobia bacterium]|nr:phosphoadenosine phosphosulfate reductase family protein [Verrucomicrobiota bacterium]MCH8510353.1 phosphoadenosine phosphosulfate reductase family protein [Kiritimatiellia bacterium]
MSNENTEEIQQKKSVRHILALSGGKDSSALAIYMKGKIPNVEYCFCDTEKELEETYEYLNKLETYLGQKIHHLKYSSGYGFDEIVQIKGGFLPSPEQRWCTEYLKLKPYEDYIGDDPVVSYVGIRADEPHRTGYISNKPNVKTVFPFVEDNVRLEDVERILEESGLGVPSYYKWRSRSGCFFCFYQQKREWVGLLENHPDLFEEAKKYEKIDPHTGERYTWNQGESLDELARPERVAQIKENYEKRKARKANAFKGNQKLKDVWGDDSDDGENLSCNICHL